VTAFELVKPDGNVDTVAKASADPVLFIGLKVQGVVACKPRKSSEQVRYH
jgi:hypothetical protein